VSRRAGKRAGAARMPTAGAAGTSRGRRASSRLASRNGAVDGRTRCGVDHTSPTVNAGIAHRPPGGKKTALRRQSYEKPSRRAAAASAPAAGLKQPPQSPQNSQAQPNPGAFRESGTPARLLGQVAKADSPEARGAHRRAAQAGEARRGGQGARRVRRRYPDYRIAEEEC